MGYGIGEKPENEIPNTNLDSYYTLSGSTVTKGQVVIIAFADPINNSAEYIGYLQNIQSLIGTNVSAVGVLYQFSGAINAPTFVSYKNTLTAAGVTFPIVNNGTWVDSAASHYNSGITVYPWVYIISKEYIIADKNVVPGSIASVIADLLKGPSILMIEPTTVANYHVLTTVGVTFSEAVLNATTAGNYTLGGAGKGTIPVNPTGVAQDGVVANKYNLTLGSGTPGNGPLDITLSNITDTLYYTPAPLLDPVITYAMDITPPAIISGIVNAGNVSITVTFSEGLYSSINATGALDAADFNVSIMTNGGTATTVTKGVVTHTAGEVSAVITLTFNHPPAGVETIEVKPVADSIYDAAGNAALTTTTTGAVQLIDVTPPVITTFSTVTAPVTSPDLINFTITGTDINGITGWIITEAAVQPSLLTAGWTAVASSSPAVINGTYAPGVSGCRNLYAWLRDAAGNVSVFSDISYLTFIYRKTPWTGLLVRDNPSDDGTVPTTGVLCQSLDVITDIYSSLNPSVDYGNYGISYWNAPDPLLNGTDYYFFIRVKNFGSSIGAGEAKAYLYFCEGTLFGSPSTWINNALTVDGLPTIKANPIAAVGAGAVGFEQTAFKWNPSVAAGHYCFIGIISTDKHPWDPVNPPKFDTGIAFTQFVENSPNICWKNYNVANAKKTKNIFVREDKLVNEWKNDFPVLVGVTVRNVPPGTIVEIQNLKIGINVRHVMAETEGVIYTDGNILAGHAVTQVKTTVTLPKENQQFAHGAQIETTAFMGVRSKAIAKSGGMVKLYLAEKLPQIQTALKLIETKGKGLNRTDSDGPAGFVRMGTYTTIFNDPGIKKPLVLDTRPVKPSLPYKEAGMTGTVKPVIRQGADVKSKAAIKAKPEVKVQSKTAVKVKPKPTVKAKTEAKAKPKTAVKIKPKAAVKPKPPVKVKPKAAVKPKPPVKDKPKTAVKIKPKAAVKPKPPVKVKPKAAVKSKPAVKVKPKAAVKAKPAVKIKVSSNKKAIRKSKPELKKTIKKPVPVKVLKKKAVKKSMKKK